MLIKRSKFYGVCYADEIPELDFYAKEMRASVEGEVLVLSFELMRLLDVKKIVAKLDEMKFFLIEDSYIASKVVSLLDDFPSVKKIELSVNKNSFKLKKMQLKLKGVLFSVL